MVRGHRQHRRTSHRRAPVAASLAFVAATLGLVTPSAADVASVAGGAFGARVTISVAGVPVGGSDPVPSVHLPPTGGSVRNAAASWAVRGPDPAGPFGGRFLTTGLLTAETWGRTGAAGSTTSSGTAGVVDVLASALTARGVSAACTTTATTATASATVTDGRLALGDGTVVALPAEPGPNTSFRATSAGGESFTVVLNEQHAAAGSLTVNAVRVVLHGPSAAGDVVLAQARCGAPGATAPPPPPVPPASSSPPPPGAEAPAATPADPPAAGSVAPPPTAAVAPAATPADAPPAGAGVRAAAAASVSAVRGGAFAYYSRVGLFGGPPANQGPAPVVELPAAGADPALTASAATGKTQYGPAVIFESGPVSVSARGTTGAVGTVTTTADIQGITDGPGPFLYRRVQSTCTATEAGTSGSTTITGGRLETKYDATTQDPVVTIDVPVSPTPNTERTGTLDHIGDSYRIVFNEQSRSGDGTLTVNAVHMHLLGPIAVGELIIGQTRCGVTASATPTSSTPAASGTSEPTASSAPAPGSVSGGTVSAASSGAGSGAPSSASTAARASGATASTSAGGEPLAFTGAQLPVAVAVTLLAVSLAARRAGRRRPSSGDDPARS